MQFHFKIIMSWLVLVFIVSGCGTNQPNTKVVLKSQKPKPVEQKIVKAKLHSAHNNHGYSNTVHRDSADQQEKNNILISNIGSNTDDVGINKISKLELKCTAKEQCARVIQLKIINRWEYPRSYPSYKTILVLDLTSEGYINTIRLKRSSGKRAFDDSVITAVRQAAPFSEIGYLPEADLAEFASIEMVFKR